MLNPPTNTERAVKDIGDIVRGMPELDSTDANIAAFVEKFGEHLDFDDSGKLRFNKQLLARARATGNLFNDFPRREVTRTARELAAELGAGIRHPNVRIVHDKLDDIPTDALGSLDVERTLFELADVFLTLGVTQSLAAAKLYLRDNPNLNRSPDGRLRNGAFDAVSQLAAEPERTAKYRPGKIRMHRDAFILRQRVSGLPPLDMSKIELFD